MTDDRLYPRRPLLAASLAVFRDNRVLLAQRFVPPMENRFTLPGGLVEPGESLSEAALREMREEVGVEARILGFNRHVEIVERDREGAVKRHYVIASFVGCWLAGEGVIGPEAQAVVWVDRDGLRDLPVSDDLRPVLDGAWAIAERAGAVTPRPASAA
ncbi:MAG: NUDIX domain-containing protein [Beijerinckiaceae bacterium]|nr:NUDIX domain-containing protein [Beijerinckiaceae bacterium]